MNTQLYNSLVQAKNFLITVENNQEDLRHRQELIKLTPATYSPYVFASKHKKFEWGTFIFLCLLTTFIGGIIYALYIDNYNKKIKQKEKSKMEQWENSMEGKQAKADAEKDIERQKKEYETKKAEYGRYFSENYPKYSCYFSNSIKTVTDVKHQIKYINGLIWYVKNGAPTLSDAMRRYGEDLRFEAELEKQRESGELEERRHKEEIQALDTIAKNQQKTIDELNRMYREKYKHI